MTQDQLLAGLIGALIVATLNFFVRLALDRRAASAAERRIAYVHFVQITELVEQQKLVVRYAKSLAVRQDLWGQQNASILLAASLAIAFQEHGEKAIDTKALSSIPASLKTFVDTSVGAKLSSEELSRLPRKAIVAYNDYQSQLSQLHDACRRWTEIFENMDGLHEVTSDQMHKDWRVIESYYRAALVLQKVLAQSAGLAEREARAFAVSKETETTAVLNRYLTDQSMLKAAEGVLREQAVGAASR